LTKLSHPNIVQLYHVQETPHHLNIIMEYPLKLMDRYCENGSLYHVLQKFGPIPESLVAVYISQVLCGLSYLHDQGVIHRDIKSAVILFSFL
jgi:serine/threonine protein kinase